MKRHTLETTIEVLGVERDISVAFFYTPAQAEQGPSYASGGEPSLPEEIEIGEVWVTLPSKPPVYLPGGVWVTDLIQDALRLGTLDASKFRECVK